MATDNKIEVFDEVADKTGDHRLLLKFIEAPVLTLGGVERAFDFHLLVWEAKNGSTWTPKITITQSDFEKGTKHRRWISEIHSLAPDTGRATIKVGEEGPPDHAGSVHVTYSWREWDLVDNKEVRIIEVCDAPFDELELPNDGI